MQICQEGVIFLEDRSQKQEFLLLASVFFFYYIKIPIVASGYLSLCVVIVMFHPSVKPYFVFVVFIDGNNKVLMKSAFCQVGTLVIAHILGTGERSVKDSGNADAHRDGYIANCHHVNGGIVIYLNALCG